MSAAASCSSFRLPIAVWSLPLSEFAVGTAEFTIAGILLPVVRSLDSSDDAAGNLTTACVVAIVIGGQVLTVRLSRFDRKKMLISLMLIALAKRHAEDDAPLHVSVSNVA